MIKFLTYGLSYAAIEHAENAHFNYLQLTKKKQEFIISDRKKFQSLDEVFVGIKDQKHLFLVLNTEQILSKKIALVSSSSLHMVSTAFPNITLSEFYYDVYSNGVESFVSIARKEYVDAIRTHYNKVGMAIIDFSLGNNIVKSTQDFFDKKTLTSSNALLEFEYKKLIAITKKEVPSAEYSINGLVVSNTEILPLSGVISYYSERNHSEIGGVLKKQYHQKQFFAIGLKGGLGFLLLILLTNFTFFSRYRNEITQLNGALLLSESYKKQRVSLQDQITKKTRVIKSMNSASNLSVSKYLDEIGISVPANILLNQIYFQPLEGLIKTDKSLVFREKEIVVAGISKDNLSFSEWISFLEKKNWIKNISITSYGTGSKGAVTANFTFIIFLE
jgi:hypothetical protein